MSLLCSLTLLGALVALGQSSDITSLVFGKELYGMPAAFGDFNSDELTDVFVLKNRTTVEIMFASNEEPLLQSRKEYSCTFDENVTSVVPGDFDGDVFMDIMVTTLNWTTKNTDVYILWGGEERLNCADTKKIVLQMKGQPLAIDYNQDMIIDLFGADIDNVRQFWIFNENRTVIPLKMIGPQKDLKEIRIPHSNAFLDLNNDFLPDLVVTTKESLEIWHGKKGGFEFSHEIDMVKNFSDKKIGQSLYLDIELVGRMDLILPVCLDVDCTESTIYVYLEDHWEDMKINFVDNLNVKWNFAQTSGERYINTITMRGGDFNMDGYPDLLATLRSGSQTRSFLLENVYTDKRGKFNRTFEVRWNALNPFYNNDSVMAVFYDFYQDGILDVIFVLKDNDVFKTAAFKNSLDYDANFVKVMVLTGRTNPLYPISPGSIGKKKRTYGTNLPGPSIALQITTQDGSPRSAMAAQLPQSAHFVMNLPFTIFGLGRTPNFINELTIGLAKEHRDWPQIIPNSQMVVIPNPPTDPSRWKAQLFVTPSKLILQSAAALTGTCGLITLIIAALYWKERREDKIEKLQEAHRFHFDAM